VRRFVEEAQIAGQLQHPGVTPVYELGAFADRRPYFTMKLVKGQTLAALLAARKGPAEDLPRFVGVFGQVCQTLAYAHARGVIHRDLKPSNVMVGAFGEVQVMDWGLAKVLPRGGAADEHQPPAQEVSVIRTGRSAGTPQEAGSHTHVGSVLGTPSYMAPEQARGAVDLVDERADVFGLGAILCEVLTGQPPFVGKSAEAHRKAMNADLADALSRLHRCGADGELIALAKHCLSAESGQRPRSAGEVADAVTSYQRSVAERLHQAELARAAEAARAEEALHTAEQERQAREAAQVRARAERQARRLTLGLAASVLALVLLGAGGGLWAQRQQAERDAEAQRHRLAFEADLDRATQLRRQAHWAEAQAVLAQARERLGETGPEDLRQRLEQAAADLDLVDRLEGIRLKRATVVEGKFDDRTAEQDYANAFHEAGLGEGGDEAEAVAARIRDSAVAEQLVAALDDWAAVTEDPVRRAWVLEVARRADPDVWRGRFRDPKVLSDRRAIEGLIGEVLGDEQKLATLRPPLLAALGSALLAANEDAVPLLTAAQAHWPNDFWLSFLLGNALAKAKRRHESVGYFRAALAVRTDAAAAHTNLGTALRVIGQLDEAIREYHRAIAIDPQVALPHNGLGTALRARGQLEEAIREYRTALEIDPRHAMTRNDLGLALNARGQPDEAIAQYRKAIELDPKLALPHNNLGTALKAKGQLDEAIREYRRAIELDPWDAAAHANLGTALIEKGHADEAVREYREAIELDPKLAPAHNGLGTALKAIGRLEEAIREYRTAIELDPKDPQAHGALGHAFLKVGRFAEGREANRRCLELLPQGHPARRLATQQLQQCEQALAREAKLAAVLQGKEGPADDAERLALARLCQEPFKKFYTTSARFYAEAFANDAKLAGDLQQQHRYNAACAAALAGCGQGNDAVALEDKERSRLRQQALDWLRADLAAYDRAVGQGRSQVIVSQRLTHWQKDDDLVGVRDKDALARLPAQEQEAFGKLWADVDALLKKAGNGK
jgi:serine/threonine-protein kinase